MRCLIVDDSPEDLISLQDALEGIAETIHTAETIKAATDYIDDCQSSSRSFPHIVFVDFSIEKQNDGATLIKYIQDTHAYSAIIIMAGAMTDEVEAAAAHLNVGIITKDALSDNTFISQVCLKAITRWSELQREQNRVFEQKRKEFLLTLGIVSHDIQNLVLGISNVAYLFRLEAEKCGVDVALLDSNEEEMETNVNLADHVLGKLTSYGEMSGRKLDPKLVNVREAIESMIKSCGNASPNLSFEFGPLVDKQLEIDAPVIAHLFKILTQNVEMHCPGETTVSISTFDEFQGDKGTLIIVFTDDGPGIEESQWLKVFLPTFKMNSTGSGMGLASAADVISDYKIDERRASIRCTKSRNHLSGACFEIRIPYSTNTNSRDFDA